MLDDHHAKENDGDRYAVRPTRVRLDPSGLPRRRIGSCRPDAFDTSGSRSNHLFSAATDDRRCTRPGPTGGRSLCGCIEPASESGRRRAPSATQVRKHRPLRRFEPA
ncbi:hypothetical protein T31B1_06430 [Salinisphaera sp. T31B1]